MRQMLPDAAPFSELGAYQRPLFGAALWQTVSTFGLYILCVTAMYIGVKISLWIPLVLAIPAAGLTVRIFVLQHDYGHYAMFPSRAMNSTAGALCSLVTLTPFAYWQRLHARHHASWNNFDTRGIPADFYADCLTVAEYKALGARRQWLYRLAHHPLLIYFVLPPLIFILVYRVPFDTPATARRARRSVYLLDLALLVIFGTLSLIFGYKTVLLVHLPIVVLAAIIGIWLFAVQHKFEHAYWTCAENWQQSQAALRSTSYLKLPRVLQWFSGNIGLHHVHHLRPGIPNYRLQECLDECPALSHAATTLSLRDALKAPRYTLWDEALGHMVPFPR
jgi:omega-6 fatty acid desaturase (delta-12 desaturase)